MAGYYHEAIIMISDSVFYYEGDDKLQPLITFSMAFGVIKWALLFASPIIAVIVLIELIKLPFRILKENRLRKSGMDIIDKMKGEDFEDRLAILFKDLGYKVKTTKRTGDFGADLILTKDDIKTAVQAKRYSKNVGIKSVQEVTGSLAKYNCHKGMVISNSYFTGQARELAKANNIELWDRDKLMKILRVTP